MNILVFGSDKETEYFTNLVGFNEQFMFRKKNYTKVADYDSFLEMLKDEYDVIFVLENGAKGMESVIASKSLRPETPLIWFSDDKNFGAQSYRLGTEFFGTKPITNEHLSLVAKKLLS